MAVAIIISKKMVDVRIRVFCFAPDGLYHFTPVTCYRLIRKSGLGSPCDDSSSSAHMMYANVMLARVSKRVQSMDLGF